jgi:hypothetical protein
VGNGESIKVWGDAWLPPPHKLFFLPPRTNLDPEMRVSSLIDGDSGWWNLSLIWSIFGPSDVARIGSIILSPLRQPDRLVCCGTPSGIFTVKSAYYQEKKRIAQTEGECSGTEEREDVWKILWSLQAPRALKKFCWKMCNNLLPTKENLFSKRITQDPLCLICLSATETIVHSLRHCPLAEAVWQECGRRIQKLSCGAPRENIKIKK